MKKKRGVCPSCNRVVAIRADGTVNSHNTKATFSSHCKAANGKYRLKALKKCEVETCTEKATHRLTIRQGGSMDLCAADCDKIRAQMVGPTRTELLRWIEGNDGPVV